MDRNVGGYDRVVRIVGAAALLVAGYRHRNRALGTLAFVAGADLLATSLLQRCPVNRVLGVDTCPGT